ncbi:Asp-tRNA(Asn)/Glu-tRNA(Gln) amidotransferase subunit GatC [Fictibacillus sp. WQ 8-8]|uniref:Aspartyl/glutamyl-tRNA(Asn/Gln) amidotransferase subunit C n=1 Tax=Fictibacillus marinisediminis TaxID=2878389 RepID=A0A9X1X7D1_9BACL|nr:MULTISPECIES: Asp-tRNA(Asn)/Glu-tRNA(Gln) amidotransferase subunit GatC [Fictibacillus]MCK6255392.1 Asp-tRNA(Asn)/Glu-tRNA(Gln) amidotransferase subunit GatC [Fictibacillus marinisediminis]MCQ6268548.1 Asp-tRNA(Asn)/Glu-tRNA(Gln) amidotransferase subunit GatC [Fictibacillus sp. WQ 8-8]UZJ78672.1 Asp-tRNA(Asn)/Glu-tRNA(Gln) amidotransferase subunit GatC [Fictibacillus sp. KU28468]
MSRISKDQVKHVAHLARLSVSEEEVDMFTEQLDAIIGFAEELNELDTENIEPTTHVLELKNVLREDTVKESVTREEALKNAPDQRDGQFKVPKTF